MPAETVDPISATAELLATELGPIPWFGHELPEDQNDSMPMACGVVSASGGPGAGGFLPIGRQRVDLKCYGRTHAEAMDVAVGAHQVLKNLRRTVVGVVLIHGFEPSSGFTTLRDGNGRWPLIFRSYLGMYDERGVA
jgi:hypothetical protein